MKIRAIVVSALVLCSIFAAIVYLRAAQPHNHGNMITEAIKSQNTPLLIKGLINKMKTQSEINDDSFPALIKEIELFTAGIKDPASVAVLHSMLAEMYNHYYIGNSWKINQRTPITGYIPEDIREWSKNLFTDKVKEELSVSLQPVELLQQTPVSAFKEILLTGKDTPALRPTLYDFLAFRVLDIQPSDSIYQALLAVYNSKPDKKGALLVNLDYLQYEYQQESSASSQNQYGKALDSLLNIYGDKEYAAEILIARLNRVQQDGYRFSNADSIQAVEYGICTEGIARYPRYERTGILRNQLATLQNPTLSVQANENVYPDKKVELKLNYKNISKITVNIYKSLNTSSQALSENVPDQKKSTLGAKVKEYTFTLALPNTYTNQDTTLYIPMENPGLYECVITSPENKIRTNNLFSVSRLATLSRNMASGETEILVTDFESGKPIEEAFVDYYGGENNKYQKLGTVKTDKDGLASLPAQKNRIAYKATKHHDTYAILSYIYPVRMGRPETGTKANVSLFTDRGIYRPGQTVFFKGIAYINEIDNPHVVEGKNYTVSLRDVNGKEVTTKQLITNKFGSFNGEFTIPRQTLSGSFTITTEGGTAYIQVEEYKRPTFFVKIQPLKGEVTFGDLVTIQGKAQTFSGVALQNGQVTYRVIQQPFWFRIYGVPQAEEQVAEGNTTVKDGLFSFSFRPEKAKNQASFFPYQSYQVVATLTDSKGETQEGRYSFSIGESSIILSANLQPRMDKDSVNAIVTARTLNNEVVTVNGNFTIYPLTDTQKEDEFKEGDLIGSGTFTSGKAISQQTFAQLPSGRYRIKLEAKDTKGRPAKDQQDFILYGKHDKRPPVFSHTWFIQDRITCLPGEEAEIMFGTSDKKVHLLYELFAGNKCVSRKRIELNDENRTFRIPFLPGYGDGVVASFTFIKEGKSYLTQFQIVKRQPNYKLTIRPETFRDRLLPGSQETWKFRILDADSVPVLAEVLAGMYDASLDQIVPFKWYFSPFKAIYLQAPWFTNGTGFNVSYQYDGLQADYVKVPDYQYDRLNWQGVMNFNYFGRNGRVAGSVSMTKSGNSIMLAAQTEGAGLFRSKKENAPIVMEDAILEESVITSHDEQESMPPAESAGQNGIPQLRENLNETAFFFPSLVTNKEGDVIMQFTLPESNTTWKLQALAHTTDLKYGMLTKEVISSKPLMVLPNLPRFLRQGDEVTISTQVINQSRKNINGRVSLELFDPATDQPVICLTKSQKPFTLAADSITTASWTFTVPTTTELIGCRIIATSDESSDGEQHLIPVLSNKILITESTPFYLMEQGEQKIQVAGNTASGTRIPFSMTLELTSNPIWYAVQALPTLTEPGNQNVVSWFASYYSNTLANYIATANPGIQKVISQWKAQGGNASTLYSNLEKNEELKTILLQETPWVLEAGNETEQKERLSLLFDLNRAAQQREAALQQILQQQNEDGGWSWFKGFPGNQEMTLYILKGMAQLTELGAIQYGQEEKMMQIKALNYLDKQIQEEYERLQKYDKNWQNSPITHRQLEYLFVRSAYRDIPELGSARDAIRFYTNKAEKQWDKQSLYGKGATALLLLRNGKKEVASQILAWLRKTATVSAEKGMYWANNRRGNDFFTSPIDTHCLLMTVFNQMSPNQKETGRMKQWLLNQKRTQNWESVPATVNAIYALLLTGSDWLNQNNTCIVQWGKQTFNSNAGETATGYIKEVIQGKEITPEMNTITVRKEGNAPAWGAVYNQYFESITQVTRQKGGLNVEKKLFVETNNGTERQIRPVTTEQPLRVGDKVIVRLTIRSDRALDYVYLKDLRAGCFEPANQISQATYRDGIWYYQSPEDVSENFFFNQLPEGTFVLEYPVYVSRPGEYAGGISSIQCLYAPEFVSHTEGNKIIVQP